MSEHPAMAHLLAAHQQAEETADRLQSELWWVGDASRFDAYLADGRQVGDIGVYGDPRGGPREVTVTEAIQRALIAASPGDLLRRVAADRELLGEHEPTWPGGEPEYGHHTETAISQTTGRTLYVEVRDTEPTPPYWCATCQAMAPCRTVLLLAKSWGWKEEA